MSIYLSMSWFHNTSTEFIKFALFCDFNAYVESWTHLLMQIQHMHSNQIEIWLKVHASAIVTSTSTPGSMLMDVWIAMLIL